MCQSVIKDMAKGFTLTAWAGSQHLSRDTVYEWVRTRAEFSDAVAIGRNLRQRYWEGRLRAAAGGSASSAVCFALRNCCREDWQDRPEVEVTVNQTIDPELLAAAKELAKKL
jgi:hypothetical protein